MVLPEGFEPSKIDPKSIVISISPWEQNDNFLWGLSNPKICVPKKLKPIAKSSTFCIIFYHKIPYLKSLNPFIFQHFRHFILSNNIMQYKHEKIQHKTPHLQKSCIFLAKICNKLKIVVN